MVVRGIVRVRGLLELRFGLALVFRVWLWVGGVRVMDRNTLPESSQEGLGRWCGEACERW